MDSTQTLATVVHVFETVERQTILVRDTLHNHLDDGTSIRERMTNGVTSSVGGNQLYDRIDFQTIGDDN